jgi:hypothetical protein
MRLNHSAIPIGLVFAGALVLGLAGRIEAAAARDCPCIRSSAGVCVPDRACEARERQKRDRVIYGRREQQIQQPPPLQQAAPRSGGGTTTGYRHGWRRPATTAGSAPTAAPVPTTARAAPRTSTQIEYRRAPTVALPPPPPSPIPPPTGEAHAPSTAAPAALPGDYPRARARPPTDAGPANVQSARPPSGGRLRILETGYSHLSELGKEEDGYGLYSYAILPSESSRAAVFLSQLFKEIPSIGDTGAQRSQLNIFYVPLKKDREDAFAALIQTSAANAEKMGTEYSRSFYDYRIARALLNHVCNPPADSIRELCDGDLSRGPYIFTYASPASSMDSVPPPFLFVDLSNVHEQAFGELIAAFRAQVKRDDITDQARIRTLRLTILDIALTAADWVNPVEKAIAEIVYSPSADDKK